MHTANTYSAQDDRHTVSDDEERKGEPSAAAGADHLSTPFQQIKALFDKIALDTNKQNRYHGRHAHHHAQQDTSITSKFHLDQGSGTQGPNDSSQDSSAGRQGGAASSDTLFGRANCLVLDALLLPKDQQASVDALVSGAGRLDKRVAVAAVLTAFPSLTAAAPVTVMVQANRLHLHFSTTALMLAASVALPALVRCCLVSTRAWSQQQRGCDGERHEMTEMLVFTCHPPSSVDFPQQAAQQLQHIKQLVQQEMNITVQSDAAIWTVNKTMGVRSANGAAAAPQRLSIHFRVLPRVVGEQEMRALVDRIHGKHKLFGGTVFVHAPNSAACIRCSECDELGHHRQACDQYGGLAVRFLFNTPMPPWELDLMKNKLGANNAYLGNAIGTCTPSRIVTVLFHTGPSVDINTLLARIQREAPTYANQTAQPIRFVNTSQRHKECRECGNDDRAHTCPFPSQLAQRFKQQQHSSVQQQQQQPRTGTAAAAPAQHAQRGGAASPAAAASPADKMCRNWRHNKTCTRKDSSRPCSFEHPSDYVLPPDGCCRDFFRSGSCKFGTQCKFNHTAQHQANNNINMHAVQLQHAPSLAAVPTPPAASAPSAAAAAAAPHPAAAAGPASATAAAAPVAVALSSSLADIDSMQIASEDATPFQTPTRTSSSLHLKRKTPAQAAAAADQQPPATPVFATANQFAVLASTTRSSSLSSLSSPHKPRTGQPAAAAAAAAAPAASAAADDSSRGSTKKKRLKGAGPDAAAASSPRH